MSLNPSSGAPASSAAGGGGGMVDVAWGEEEAPSAAAAPLTAAQKKAKQAAKKAGPSKVVEVEEPRAAAASPASPASPSAAAAASQVEPTSQAEAAALAAQAAEEPMSPFSKGEVGPLANAATVVAETDEHTPTSAQVEREHDSALEAPAAVAAATAATAPDTIINEHASIAVAAAAVASTSESAPAEAAAPSSLPTSSSSASSSSLAPPVAVAHLHSSPSPSSIGAYRSTPIPQQALSKCPTYLAFKKSVGKQRCVVGSKTWVYYELGPKDGTQPLVCIPGTSGTAESFFFQLMSLGNRGYRVIAVSPPEYYTPDEWCNGFNGFLGAMGLTGPPAAADRQPNSPTPALATTTAATSASSSSSPSSVGKVHVFANSLAGYLCLYYLSHILPARNYIASLVLCNSFSSTASYQEKNGSSGWCIALLKRAPAFMVRKYVLDSLPERTLYPEAVDFMVEQMQESLTTEVLASRLILNIVQSRGVADTRNWRRADGSPFPQANITIMDTTDESVVPAEARQRLYDALPDARYAFVKQGGDLPFLSVSDEINMHLVVHLRHHGVFPSNKTTTTVAAATPTTTTTSSTLSSSTSSHDASPANPSPSVLNDLATVPHAAHPFLQPSFSHAALGKTKHSALGFGHDEDEDENDSIFISRPSASPSTAHPTTSSSGKPLAGSFDSHDGNRSRSSSISLISPHGSLLDEREEEERAALFERLEAEAMSLFASSREAAAKEREEDARREAEQLAIENAKEAKQSAVLEELLDESATEDEQRLTQKKPVKRHPTEDLF